MPCPESASTSKTINCVPLLPEADPSKLAGNVKEFWRALSPSNTEQSIKNSWCACIREDSNRKSDFFIGRIVRFLIDAEGPVDKVEIDC